MVENTCPAITITDLDYADDLATISDCIADAQQILTEIESAAALCSSWSLYKHQEDQLYEF